MKLAVGAEIAEYSALNKEVRMRKSLIAAVLSVAVLFVGGNALAQGPANFAASGRHMVTAPAVKAMPRQSVRSATAPKPGKLVPAPGSSKADRVRPVKQARPSREVVCRVGTPGCVH